MSDMSRPLKNVAFTLSFSLFRIDGTVIANPGTYTKKVSVDGGAIADIAAAVTEEDTTYGQLSLVLAAGEMNGDFIWVMVKDDTAGCIPFVVSLYPAAAQVATVTETAALDAKIDTIDTVVDGIVTTMATFADSDDVANAVCDEVLSGHTDAGSLAEAISLLKTIIAHKSVENEAGNLVTYRNAGDTADAGTQTWDEGTKTRGEYTPV